ncbi:MULTISPECIES: amidohydrolase family protein [unclassified Beijerinckia]|uniref:amidohydrolase family protein n=1 Tax=unclassified Beijerinckia TaxID=2638183 RepID=UPI0008943E48|nr:MULTISPECIES: amidohydrolase family protein [unclassified Beijerinckia]MDH7797223.1 2-pyrone-4,6-dicarboxylate lactonase [Beijerinckia sp. GAS462]SEC76940.1 Predicted metal-dependent hydrolase, TIM-barrel fold [Beijerinckia sp. 28-YEA-48]
MLSVPAGACDCHCHVIGPTQRFAQAAFSGDIPEAWLDRHAAALKTMGLSRAVIVQPSSVYGFDDAAFLDALRARPEAYRGVAIADATVSDAQLEAWRALGVRALRFVEIKTATGGRLPGSVGFDDLARLAPRLRAFGMHAHIWADCETIVGQETRLLSLGIDIVLDHMGKPNVERGVDDPAFQRLCALLSEGRLWVKLALCRNSRVLPDYPDLRPFHDALVKANPDRLLWGSDWPHLRMGDMTPDVGQLIGLLLDWIGDEDLARRILATNPTRLFGFAQV